MAGPGGSAAVEQARAAQDLVRHLDLPGRPFVFVGVVGFADLAYTKSWLTNDERVIGSLRFMGGPGGAEIDRGLAAADRVLQRGRQHRPPEDTSEVVVLFSRARDDNGCDPSVSAARSLKDKGALLMTVCVSDDCDAQCSRRIASSPQYAFSVSGMDPVKAAFDRIMNRGYRAARLVVTDTLGADVAYASGSALPAASRTSAEPIRWLAWETNTVPTSGITISVKVRPLESGQVWTNALAAGLFEDDSGGFQRWTFDSPSVYVRAPAPTATRSPSATTTPPPSTSTPSSSPTPSAVPTPIEQELLLPYALMPPR